MSTFRLILMVTVSATLLVDASAQAPIYKLTRYVDGGSQVPGAEAGVVFTGFEHEGPSLQNGVLAFCGYFDDPGTGATEGIFTVDASGTVTPVVFNTDPAPGGGVFQTVTDELFNGSQVAWRVFPNDAIYTRNADGSGPFSTIVDTRTAIPGTTAFFEDIYGFGTDGDRVLFDGYGTEKGTRRYWGGIYSKNLVTDTVSVYADRGTASPFPGAAATLVRFGEPMARDGRVTCWATDSNRTPGLLTDFGAGLVGPVNNTVQSPSGLGNFSWFDESSIDGDRVVFQARTSVNQKWGVYMYDHSTGTFTAIADETVPRPDGGFFDSSFNGDPALSIVNGVTTVIFESSDDDLWAWIDGLLVPVVHEGDSLDGKIVSGVTFDVRYGAEGTTTAFKSSFADGTEALYLAEFQPCAAPASTPSGTAIENGTGVNCVCYTAVNSPVLGTVWQSTVTSLDPADMTLVMGYMMPGSYLLPAGELLVNPMSKGVAINQLPWQPLGTTHSVMIPNDMSLQGRSGYFQGATVRSGATGLFASLCNSVVVTLQ